MTEEHPVVPGTVVIGYTHTGKVHEPFMQAVVRMVMYDVADTGRHVVAGVLGFFSPYIPDARNKVVEEFLEKTNAEWLWFLDYDMDFDPKALYDLLDAADPDERPIMGGMYFIHSKDHIVPVFYDKTGPITEFAVPQILDLWSTGMGCTLIHRDVFLKMRAQYGAPWPWFAHDYIDDRWLGEDVTFCKRAREMGYKVYGHTGVQCDHIKQFVLNIFAYADSGDVKAKGPNGDLPLPVRIKPE